MKDGDSIIISLTYDGHVPCFCDSPIRVSRTMDYMPEWAFIELDGVSMSEYNASNFALYELWVNEDRRLVHGGPAMHLDSLVGRSGFAVVHMGRVVRGDVIAADIQNTTACGAPFTMLIRGTVRDRRKM